MKIIFIFSCSGMFRDVPECSGMFRNVPECSGMLHVPGFIDARKKWRIDGKIEAMCESPRVNVEV